MLLSSSYIALSTLQIVITAGALWKESAILMNQFSQIFRWIFSRELCKFGHDSFAYHIILCKSASLISNQKLNASEFLRYVWISSNGSWYLGVNIDTVTVPHFCKIEINSQRNGYDTGQKKNHSEIEHQPFTMETIQEDYGGWHYEHENKQNLWEVVDLKVK